MSGDAVRRYDYPAQFGEDLEPVIDSMRRALLGGDYGVDGEVAAFEREFASFLGTSYACGVNTGTDALIVVLRTLGIGPGDEVITQANTFHATVAAICLVGATPVLVDADDRSFLIDTAQIDAAVTSRTRALVPVHLYGRATPMDDVLRLADRHGLHVIEDAAQAHGAHWDGRRAGAMGVAGCFSFHSSKNLAAAGDGGAVVTADGALAEQMEVVRSLGQRRQNDHVLVGPNTRLHSLQAIVLRAKLAHLDEWNAARACIAAAFRAGLNDCPVSFQEPGAEGEHVYHLFQVRSVARDELVRHLCHAQIDTVVRYPVPIHLQPAFSDQGWSKGEFPVAEALAEQLLCLPIRPDMRKDEIEYVIQTTRDFFT